MSGTTRSAHVLVSPTMTRQQTRALQNRQKSSWPRDYNLMCFGPRNRFRTLFVGLVEGQSFDAFITVVVIVSTLALTVDVPRLDRSSALAYVLESGNYIFTYTFATEAVLKVCASRRSPIEEI
eukprot:7297183-Prymnesium_polylepis.1